MPTDLSRWTPRPLPADAPLAGDRVILRPTDPAQDANALYDATSTGDPALWDYLPYGPFDSADAFGHWLAKHIADPGLMPRTIVDRASGEPLGCASFMRMDTNHGVIEIGHIFFGPGLQRTPHATEAIFLMLRHTFDDLGYRRLEWKCDAANQRSRRAAERFGFQPEGIFRQHRIVKGKNRDTAWFAIIDSEWPVINAGFRAWLDETNFDDQGIQRRSLRECRMQPQAQEQP